MNRIVYLIQEVIAKIDGKLHWQINQVLHHPVFQKLEASWRGLHFLTTSIGKLNNIKIKIKMLNICWNTLSKDLTRSTEFDQSQLFKLIYSEEFGSPGGEPYGLLIGDYEISHRTQKNNLFNDLNILSAMAKIASAAFAPFIAMPAPSVFGLDDFTGLGRQLNIEKTFQQTEYTFWKSLRQEEEMRFVGLILPHLLQRLPYEKENVQKLNHYLWGNPCYAFAANVARAFSQSGWLADIRGGTVDHTPRHYFNADRQKIFPLLISQADITEFSEKNLSDFGFITLSHCKYSHLHAFHHCPSLYQTKSYENNKANTNEKLSSMLNYVLCASRFAHYIKIIARHKIGSFISARDCTKILGDWLRQYTASGNDLSRELQAKYPLKEAKVEIFENKEKPGAYFCKIYISPHYRFEQIETYLQLTTEIY